MSPEPRFFSELKRRHVVRAGVLYVGTVWALAQGIAQLAPVFGAPEWTTRWFVIAAAIGFPLWIAFAWFYEFTPQGLKREDEAEQNRSFAPSTARKLDFAIIAVLAVAVVLLLTNSFVWRRSAGPANGTQPVIPVNSIAVLPLTNESGDKDQQYFSDGLSEDLIAALSQFAGLKVISRDSAFKFRNSHEDSAAIGEKLGVAHLLEGSVQHAGSAVRISATLVNASDGATLWAQHYDRPYKDLFALQDDITRAVAGALKARLLESGSAVVQSDRPPSGNLEAYQAYQQGTFHYAQGTEADERIALERFAAATRLDSRYAAAFAGLAMAEINMAGQFLGGENARETYDNARTAANTALSLDSNLAVAHHARGLLLSRVDFNWSGAEGEYRRALQLAPGNAGAKFDLGDLLATLGQPQRAVELTRQALLSDPLNAAWHNDLATYLAALGRFEEARRSSQQAIALQPQAEGFYEQLAVINILDGQPAAALRAAESEPQGAWRNIAVALAMQASGDPSAADAALNDLINKDGNDAAYQIAQVYALRRDPDNTFKWLDRAWSSRDSGIDYLLYDPLILRYKRDPRFAAFCKKLGLPAPDGAAVQHAASAASSARAATAGQ